MIPSSSIQALGALLALVAVAAGAFGAHMLKEQLTAGLFEAYKTGVHYQMYHALALILAGKMYHDSSKPIFSYTASAFLLGIVLFSGSLYLLSLTETRWIGVLTPLGGLSFLIGWFLFAKGFIQTDSQNLPF
ncbi:MAG: DUF423 domain-containing protein [Nitrospirales bacterium]|nr:DUF423 domain-containing protein [Nitrospirales bacterium]